MINFDFFSSQRILYEKEGCNHMEKTSFEQGFIKYLAA